MQSPQATIEEITNITLRNLRVVKDCEIQSKTIYEKAYYKGKKDAIKHIAELLKETEGK